MILFSPSGQLANDIVVTGEFSDQIPANGNRAGLHRRTTHLISTDGINIVGPITHRGDSNIAH